MTDEIHVDDIRRYAELPRYTREWIANLRQNDINEFEEARKLSRLVNAETLVWMKGLRKEDIAEIDEARRLIRSMRAASGIWKTVFVTFFGAIIMIGGAYEHIGTLFRWIGKKLGGP